MDFVRTPFAVGIKTAFEKVGSAAAVMRGDQVHGQIEHVLTDRLSRFVEQIACVERVGEFSQ